jgi:hypothetical protein
VIRKLKKGKLKVPYHDKPCVVYGRKMPVFGFDKGEYQYKTYEEAEAALNKYFESHIEYMKENFELYTDETPYVIQKIRRLEHR